MSAVPADRRAGLLFVHGIGEQKRFEHLLEAASDIAELMLQADPGSTIVTLDLTADWKLPAGTVDPSGRVPLSMTLTGSDGSRTIFECREVWWADLGARSGLFDTVGFWFWALGQWGAPIYRLLDAAQTSDDAKDEPPIAELPRSAVGTTDEFWARAKLALVALCAAMAALSWVLIKRVFSKLFGTAPSPTLIVQYVGDVHAYEERAAPGATNLSDPGFPRRVAIRRRMITEMVAMASSGLDAWHVVAHSLGSVLAYNGLTEIGHTLPNYLPKAQWDGLPARLKQDANCRLRRKEEISEMMPARAPWLDPADVLNRELLFANLTGLLTYGSPLDKFAALWPRIVATATDRKDGGSAFAPNCAWINYYAPEDPVGAHLDYFTSAPFGNAVPTVLNKRRQPGWQVGLAHILYFSGIERFEEGEIDEQKRAVAGWLSGVGPVADIGSSAAPEGIVILAYIVLVAGMWAVSSAMVTLVGGILKALLGASAAVSFLSSGDFLHASWEVAPAFVGYLLTIVLLMGLLRWYRESWLNGRLLSAELIALKKKPGDPTEDRKISVAKVVGKQKRIALVTFLSTLVISAYGIGADAGEFAPWAPPWPYPGRFSGVVGAMFAILTASAVQTLFNRPTQAIDRLGGRSPTRTSERMSE